MDFKREYIKSKDIKFFQHLCHHTSTVHIPSTIERNEKIKQIILKICLGCCVIYFMFLLCVFIFGVIHFHLTDSNSYGSLVPTNPVTIVNDGTNTNDNDKTLSIPKHVLVIPVGSEDQYKTITDFTNVNFSLEPNSAATIIATQNGWTFTEAANLDEALRDVSEGSADATLLPADKRYLLSQSSASRYPKLTYLDISGLQYMGSIREHN